MNKFALLGIGMLIGFSAVVHASENDIGIQSIRQKAMGGAGIALVSSETALLRNPAGLYQSGNAVKLPRLAVDLNDDYQKNQDDLKTLAGSNNNPSKQLKSLRAVVPLQVGTRIAFSPALSLTSNKIGFGLFGESNILANLKRKTNPVLFLQGYTDIVAAIGTARKFNLMGNTIIGISGKYIHRSILFDPVTGKEQIEYTTADILKIINNISDKKDKPETFAATGFGIDLGMLRKLDLGSYGKGHWGLTVHNIGATLKGSKKVGSANQDVERTIPITSYIGMGMDTSLLRRIPAIGAIVGDVTVAADYKIVSKDTSWRKNLHLGIEKSLFSNVLKLRGGLNQGYVVGGIGLDISIGSLPIVHLDYVNTTQEFGNEIGLNTYTYQGIQFGVLF